MLPQQSVQSRGLVQPRMEPLLFTLTLSGPCPSGESQNSKVVLVGTCNTLAPQATTGLQALKQGLQVCSSLQPATGRHAHTHLVLS